MVLPRLLRSAKSTAHEPVPRDDRHRILAILIMGMFVVFFRMGFEQAGGVMNLFADKQTDRILGGWEIPASVFQPINALGIILLGPIFASIWTQSINRAFHCRNRQKWRLV